MNVVVGLLLALAIGVGRRWFDLPLPALPLIVGALLAVFMTLGFLGADFAIEQMESGG